MIRKSSSSIPHPKAAATAKDRSSGAEGGSSTPYHIIEILINSGGDNLPGVSFIISCVWVVVFLDVPIRPVKWHYRRGTWVGFYPPSLPPADWFYPLPEAGGR